MSVNYHWPSFAASLLVEGKVTCILSGRKVSMWIRIKLVVLYEQNAETHRKRSGVLSQSPANSLEIAGETLPLAPMTKKYRDLYRGFRGG